MNRILNCALALLVFQSVAPARGRRAGARALLSWRTLLRIHDIGVAVGLADGTWRMMLFHLYLQTLILRDIGRSIRCPVSLGDYLVALATQPLASSIELWESGANLSHL